ncbi:TonB-dependent receptor [Thauera sp. Sel9]|uniref:TonB-dependent receptor n=1 Tax=Thauera sp. Sel9 TaxID=2974299 RepID=UPI0021E105DA|nr:TonB-dependent receptor [Thauera sp. Sel9]MCV2216300.1 TonB-dependent receptor [Thauera sp. Sel9]
MPGVAQVRKHHPSSRRFSSHGRRNLRLNATLLCILAAFLAPESSQAQTAGTTQQQGVRSYDIGPGPLAEVLNRFAREAGVLLSFDAQALQGRHSSGVQGSHAVGEGFRQLLAGSGLQAVATGANRYMLRPLLPDIAGEDDPARNATEMKSVLVTGERTKDEVGHDNVYEKDISNLYVDRKYMDRYKGVSTGDVFAGTNGVYNIDNRNGSALSPIIRGFSGNGRIPITVDGTVQTLDVWQAVHGISNRSYVDPNLFRSIEVEKGPSMTRGIKSGVGGSVNIRTIDATDIIEPGKSWGLEIKAGTANNSREPSFNAHSYEGRDYRDIEGAASGSTLFGTPGVGFYRSPTRPREKGGSSFNGDAYNVFLAGGYQHEAFDVMAAYSDQKRGNYYAGKKGADKYIDNTARDQLGVHNTRNMYPDIGKVFPAGYEVPYTSSHTESYLLKSNWKIDQDQKLSFGYTRNKLQFGELPVPVVDYFVNQAAGDDWRGIDGANTHLEYPNPDTTVKQDIWRLGYELKPAGSRLLDLEANLWRTDSRSSRYQTGDYAYGVTDRDMAWDQHVQCNYDQSLLEVRESMPWYYEMYCPGISPGGPAPERQPNTDGRYNLKIGNRIDSHAVRTGFDLSNRFRLSERLSLTTAIDYQYEEVRDNKPVKDVAVILNGSLAQAYGPASGRRSEYGVSSNLEWQATDRLQLSAGVRYGGYWGFDDETARQRAAKTEEWRVRNEAVAQNPQMMRLMNADELAMYSDVGRYEEWEAYKAANNMTGAIQWGADNDGNNNGLLYAGINTPIPLNNGKADRSQNPFHNGSIDIKETVTNPTGMEGSDSSAIIVPGIYKKYIAISNVQDSYAYKSDTDPWKRPETQKATAWSTQLAASYLLTERSRVYVRYASMARFASLLETANRLGFGDMEFADMKLRPERNKAWEIGYHHDLSGLLFDLQRADVKLAWYRNTIHDYYDRSIALTTIQFDRKISSGIELQGRFDTGRFYGNLGATYRLKQEMCDKDYAVQLDPHYNRVPECMDGGLIGTLSYSTLQPKYSVNLDLGTRLLEHKLDLGMRVRHHSKAENDSMDRMLARHQSGGFSAHGYDYPIVGLNGNNRPYFWDPVTLLDLYAEYRITRDATVRLSVDNLTNRYYMDPLTRLTAPAPGRTAMLDLNVRF